jgi:O-antigen/teichoic acid export membrane protein
MNRAFAINLIFLIAINLLIKPFYLFGIDRVVQNTVADGEYGLYFTFFNLAYLFQIINDFGIQHYNSRNIAQHNQLLEKYFSNIIVLKLGLGFLFMILLTATALILGYRLQQLPFLLWIGFNQVLVSLIFYLRSNVSGLGHYRLDSIFSVMEKLFMIIICGGLLIIPASRAQFHINWFVWAQSFSLFLTAAIAFIWVQKRVKPFRFRIRPAMLLLIIKRSYPFSLILLFMTIYTRSDSIMIERLLADGLIEADRYASAFRLLDAANMAALLFPTLLLPMFAKLLGERSDVGPLAHLGLKTIWAGAISGGLAIYFFRTEIMVLLYDTGDAYSGAILGYLMLTFLAMSGTYIYGTLLVANNNTRALNILFAVSVVANITLNFLLIPTYKAQGAAIATLITQTGVFIGECVLTYRLMPVRPDWSVFIRTGLLAAAAIGVYVLFIQHMNTAWSVKFFMSIGISIILSFILRLIDVSYWFRLIREKPA